MAVGSRIMLPPAVRVKDVAKCLGILAGLSPHREDGYLEVNGVSISPAHSEAMCSIGLSGRMVEGRSHSVYYFFESEGGDYRLLLPPSTPFWITLGKGLVDFFGGRIIYRSYDRKSYYSRAPRSNEFLVHFDKAVNKKFYLAMESLDSITTRDIIHNRKFAAQ